MYKIQNKIKDFLDKKSARKLMQETWIGSWAIYSIMNWHKNKKYTKQTLDAIYDFFWLQKDIFYNENIKLHSGQGDPLWILFKKRREKLWLKREKVAKLIKWTDRHMRRIEAWDSTYKINSYYIKKLVELYQFNPEETNSIMFYISSLSDILKLVKEKKCPWIEQLK